MAGRGMQTSGPSSGSQEALRSMINQFQTKLKSNESMLSSNKKRILTLEDQNVALKRENFSLKERISSLEKENEHMTKTHGKQKSDHGDLVLSPKAMRVYPGALHNFDHSKLSPASSSSSDVTVNSGTGFVPGRNREGTPFCAEIFEGKLSHDPDVKLKFIDLALNIGEKLSQLGDVQVRESNLKLQIENWKTTAHHLLQFFVLLHGIVIGSGDNDSTTWLDVALESKSNWSVKQDMSKMWRLLQWHIHHSVSNSKKSSPKSQVKIDEWFAQQMEKLEIPDDIELTVANLLKSMSRDFGGVKEEVEGLSMSISMDPEEESSGVSSSDSSLSSTIPAQDLWTFKSILQDLVERLDDFYQKYALMAKSADLDGLDEMERDMYLPQREALENYDLGKLLRLMSSVIQSLSQEVISVNAGRGLCQRCGQDINMEAKGDRNNDLAFRNQRTKGQPMGFISAGPPSGLKSRESAGHIQGVRLPPPDLMMTGGAMPKVPTAVRPAQGTFHGIHGPLPPRELTVLQNTNPHVRSKSDTSISPQQRKVVDQSLVSKPSSLDSVYRRKNSPLDVSTLPSPVMYSAELGEHLSDSDEEFQVRGPPDTPPEVRSIERMQIGRDSFEHPSESSGRLGAFSKYAMQSASQPRDNGALYDSRFQLSQVHQCTGDSSGTTHDMVLPSSVQWSTVQLKDGGMVSPTLEVTSPRNTAHRRSQHMNYFSTIPQDSLVTSCAGDVERDGFKTLTNVLGASYDSGKKDPCPVCKMTFPDYVPVQAVQSHINLHFDENPGSFEVITENYNSLNK